jgi:hypothetical protein
MAEGYQNVKKHYFLSFKIFQFFFLFGIISYQEIFEKKPNYKTSGDLQTYFVSWEIIKKSSIWILPNTTGSFWIQSLQTFFVWSFLGLKDFRRLTKVFSELRDYEISCLGL